MDRMLEGKIVLITGSASGIGAATAELAHEYGAKVILHDRDDNERLRHHAEKLNAKYIVCDVAEKQAVETAVNEVLDEIRHIDALINCAGIVSPKPFLELTDWDFLKIFNVDMLGTAHFCQAVIPQMQKRHYGRIVNIGISAWPPGHLKFSRYAIFGRQGWHYHDDRRSG